MNKIPQTISELKQWYIENNLPPEETTRFFIGKNYTGAKAFGIYFDEATEDYIVYKNKTDGSRAVRYRGKDEEYAVSELFRKLKDEIYNQKMNNSKNFQKYNLENNYYNNNYNYTNSNYNYGGKKIKLISPSQLMIFIVVFTAIILIIYFFIPKNGYYNYNGTYYYCQNGSWYVYSSSWRPASAPKELKSNRSKYYESSYYSSYYDVSDFSYSSYYEEPSYSSSSSSSSSSHSWSSGSDWDSGSSWDSDFTDFDSDW